MKRLLCVAVAAAFGVGAFANSNLLTNGSFETGHFSPWVLNDGSFFDVVQTPSEVGDGSLNAEDGTYLAIFGQATATPTILSQTFADTNGTQYDVVFYLGAGVDTNGSDSVTVNWDGTTLLANAQADYTPDGSYADLSKYQFTSTGTGSDTLKFTISNPDSYDGLDNVQVTPVGSPSTPGPAAVIPFALGLLRRRKKATGK